MSRAHLKLAHSAEPVKRTRPLECAFLRKGREYRVTRGVHPQLALARAVLALPELGIPGDVAVATDLSTGRLVFEAHYTRRGEILVHWFIPREERT